MAVSPCAPGYAMSGGSCVDIQSFIPPDPAPPGTTSGPQPRGNVTTNPGITDSPDPFTDVILTIVGAGVGGLIGGGGGAALGGQLGGSLTSAVVSALSNVFNVNFGGTDLSALLRNIPSAFGAGPDLRQELAAVLAAQPFDPGGFGGGVLTAAPYLGQAGPLAGSLLKSGKIKLEDLLTGRGKSVSALAGVLQGEGSRRVLGLVG